MRIMSSLVVLSFTLFLMSLGSSLSPDFVSFPENTLEIDKSRIFLNHSSFNASVSEKYITNTSRFNLKSNSDNFNVIENRKIGQWKLNISNERLNDFKQINNETEKSSHFLYFFYILNYSINPSYSFRVEKKPLYSTIEVKRSEKSYPIDIIRIQEKGRNMTFLNWIKSVLKIDESDLEQLKFNVEYRYPREPSSNPFDERTKKDSFEFNYTHNLYVNGRKNLCERREELDILYSCSLNSSKFPKNFNVTVKMNINGSKEAATQMTLQE